MPTVSPPSSTPVEPETEVCAPSELLCEPQAHSASAMASDSSRGRILFMFMSFLSFLR